MVFKRLIFLNLITLFILILVSWAACDNELECLFFFIIIPLVFLVVWLMALNTWDKLYDKIRFDGKKQLYHNSDRLLNFFYKYFFRFKLAFFYDLVRDAWKVLVKNKSFIWRIIKWYLVILFVLYSLTYSCIYLGLSLSSDSLLYVASLLMKIYNFWIFPIARFRVPMHRLFRFCFRWLFYIFVRGPKGECMGNNDPEPEPQADNQTDRQPTYLQKFIFSQRPQTLPYYVNPTENSENCAKRAIAIALHLKNCRTILMGIGTASSTAIDEGLNPLVFARYKKSEFFYRLDQIMEDHSCFDEATMREINNQQHNRNDKSTL